MTEINLGALDRCPADTVTFIKVFMRFEYAMKKIGFAKFSDGGFIYDVNWKTFSKLRMGQKFFASLRDNMTVRILLREPPHQQFQTGIEVRGREGEAPADNTDGPDSEHLEFRPTEEPLNVQQLFYAVGRVRHNVFHNSEGGNADRENALVTAALNVLLEALRYDEELRAAFEGIDIDQVPPHRGIW